MTRKIPIAQGEFYHIYNRGVDKRLVFCNESDYKRFILLLFLCNDTKPIKLRGERKNSTVDMFNTVGRKTLVDICAYCLMPNHFHLLVYEKNEHGVSTFMQKLTTAYTMYFNKRYDRTGSLFQGTYKSSLIDTDPYLSRAFVYIHLNPIKLSDPEWKNENIPTEKTLGFLKKYTYSSYLDYFGANRSEKTIINKSVFPHQPSG
jgi:putative transposase